MRRPVPQPTANQIRSRYEKLVSTTRKLTRSLAHQDHLGCATAYFACKHHLPRRRNASQNCKSGRQPTATRNCKATRINDSAKACETKPHHCRRNLTSALTESRDRKCTPEHCTASQRLRAKMHCRPLASYRWKSTPRIKMLNEESQRILICLCNLSISGPV